MLNDTIAAIATPIGSGGIGIIRLSGSGSLKIAEKIFKPKGKVKVKEIPSFSLRLGNIVSPDSKEIVDEVLLSVMRAPKSYTGEDVVEINCHGGPVVMEKILRLTLEQGARLAEAGEFTKRAFLNGRVDLAQAEAVIDLIEAKTDLALGTAVKQLQGGLSRHIKKMQRRLTSILAQMEASIDFPEDVGEINCVEAQQVLASVKAGISRMIEEGQQGKILREGLKTVIIGRPNVGKSSLLNALVRENRAIVTEIPGTTRDIIEEIINLNGIPLKIIDTAGIRETKDIVEKMGVTRAEKLLNEADLNLFVIDASTSLTGDDKLIAGRLKRENTIILLNKGDIEVTTVTETEINQLLPGFPVIKISAKEEWGLDKLADKIKEKVFAGQVTGEEREVVTRSRQLAALKKSLQSVEDAVAGLKAGSPVDLVVIDVKQARESLGEITGETIGEDILDTIFKEFCIGK